MSRKESSQDTLTASGDPPDQHFIPRRLARRCIGRRCDGCCRRNKRDIHGCPLRSRPKQETSRRPKGFSSPTKPELTLCHKHLSATGLKGAPSVTRAVTKPRSPYVWNSASIKALIGY